MRELDLMSIKGHVSLIKRRVVGMGNTATEV